MKKNKGKKSRPLVVTLVAVALLAVLIIVSAGSKRAQLNVIPTAHLANCPWDCLFTQLKTVHPSQIRAVSSTLIIGQTTSRYSPVALQSINR